MNQRAFLGNKTIRDVSPDVKWLESNALFIIQMLFPPLLAHFVQSFLDFNPKVIINLFVLRQQPFALSVDPVAFPGNFDLIDKARLNLLVVKSCGLLFSSTSLIFVYVFHLKYYKEHY